MNLNLKKPIGVTIAMQQGTQPTIVFGIQRISSKAKAKAEKARPKAKAEARGKEKVEKAKKEDELTEIFQPITNQKKHTTRKINGHATRHLCFLERQFFIGLQYLILILQKMLFFEPFDAFWVVSVLFAVKL